MGESRPRSPGRHLSLGAQLTPVHQCRHLAYTIVLATVVPVLYGCLASLLVARHELFDDSASARSVADAHDQAEQLMVELRELIHGIRLQILADSGLTAALRDLADQSPIPVRMESELPGHPDRRRARTGSRSDRHPDASEIPG